MKNPQVRLSYMTFTLCLEEMLTGPTTAKQISEATGMTHRNACRLMRTMHAKQVVHISGWDKDSIGRNGIRLYSLGAGKDAKKANKSKSAINRDYKARQEGAFLRGTPFAGLGG